MKLRVHVLRVMFIRLCFTCQDVGGLVGTPRFLCVSFSRPAFGVSFPSLGTCEMCGFSNVTCLEGCFHFQCDVILKDVSLLCHSN